MAAEPLMVGLAVGFAGAGSAARTAPGFAFGRDVDFTAAFGAALEDLGIVDIRIV
ncbi:MAG TPA: hypothetical protein VF711_11060 [Acidimicrobiales bacterium]